jgi:hypothetical protein
MSKVCGEGVEIEKIARAAAEISKSLRNRVKRHLESEPFPPKIFRKPLKTQIAFSTLAELQESPEASGCSQARRSESHLKIKKNYTVFTISRN